MKQHRLACLLTLTLLLLIGTSSVHSADNKPAGPKGGRLLDKTNPRAEFLLEKDRTATIRFYDATLKPVPATSQTLLLIAESKAGKTKVEFEKKGDLLISKSPLPDGVGYNLVLQFRASAEARPQNLRFKLDLATCKECHRAEYACICSH